MSSRPRPPHWCPTRRLNPPRPQATRRSRVAFTAPFNGGSPITDYTAACTSSNGGTAGSNTGASSPIVVTALTNGKNYTCTVLATNGDGDGPESPASATATPQTVPDTPAKPTVAAGDTQITVTFAAPANGGSPITGYTATCTSSNGGTAGIEHRRDLADHRHRHSPTARPTPAPSSPPTATATARSPAPSRRHRARVPSAPAQPTVTAGDTQITVTFGAPGQRRQPDHRLHGDVHVVERRHRRLERRGAASPIVVTGLDQRQEHTPAPSSPPTATATATLTRIGSRRSEHASPTRPPNRRSPRATRRSPSPSRARPTAAARSPATRRTCTSSQRRRRRIDRRRDAHRSSSAASPTARPTRAPSSRPTPTATARHRPHRRPRYRRPSPTRPRNRPSAAGDAQITVTFAAPFNGGSAITGYTATCTSSNGGAAGSNSGSGSPIVVTGLTNGKNYTCTVFATNGERRRPRVPASNSAISEPRPGRARPTHRRRGQRADHGHLHRAVQRRERHHRLHRHVHVVQRRRRRVDTGARAHRSSSPASPTARPTRAPSSPPTATATDRASPASATAVPKTVPDAPAQPTVDARQRTDHRRVRRAVQRRERDHRLHRNVHVVQRRRVRIERGAPLADRRHRPDERQDVHVHRRRDQRHRRRSRVAGVRGRRPEHACPTRPPNPRSAPATRRSPSPSPRRPTAAARSPTTPRRARRPTAAPRVTTAPPPRRSSSAASTNGKTYTCTVVATNANGDSPASPASATATPKTVPDAPAKPTVSAGNAQITVTFTAPSNGGSAITGYTADVHVVRTAARPARRRQRLADRRDRAHNGKTYTCTVLATQRQRRRARVARVGRRGSEHRPRRAREADGRRRERADHRDLLAPVQRRAAPITSYTASCTSSNGGTPGSKTGAASPIVVGSADQRARRTRAPSSPPTPTATGRRHRRPLRVSAEDRAEPARQAARCRPTTPRSPSRSRRRSTAAARSPATPRRARPRTAADPARTRARARRSS